MARLDLLFAVRSTVPALEEELGLRFEEAHDEDLGDYWELDLGNRADVDELRVCWNNVTRWDADVDDGDGSEPKDPLAHYLEPEFPSDMLLLFVSADDGSPLVRMLFASPTLRLLRREEST